MVQAGGYLGVHWLVEEAREEEENLEEEDLVGVGKGLDVVVCKVRVVADGCEVQEGALGHGDQDQVEVLEA